MSHHPPLKEVEKTRPDFDSSVKFSFTKTPDPDWTRGQGSNYIDKDSSSKNHIEIDPYEAGRPVRSNYTLLISGIIPRPIGFISTLTKDGSVTNLAPFSFTQVVNFDPPIFVVGISGNHSPGKDTLRNVLDTQECVINTVSEHFVEAANMAALNCPPDQSEVDLSGLTMVPSSTVKPPRVKESVFSVECKLVDTKIFHSRANPDEISGTTLFLEGTRFWAREDAIDEDRRMLDPAKLRSVGRAGGITYTRTTSGFELERFLQPR
ncbi:polynucleotide adenylyltransferase [Ascosphaera pollenicola]|nr:polynucleotide adenylyltransferase [Ascosphaera pollenicola]